MHHDLRGGLSRCRRKTLLLLLCLVTAGALVALALLRSPHPRALWQQDDVDDAPQQLRRPPVKEEYVIHVWRHGERMKRRFLRSYGREERDPLESCSVRNCRLTTDDALANASDALLVHLHQTKGPGDLPRQRAPGQLWVFFTDESPLHTFLANPRQSVRDYDARFNWSMTYRADSDVPVPYGRTVPLTADEAAAYEATDHARARTRGVAALGSNCAPGGNRRWEYVRELSRHVPVDVYGGCGSHRGACPGHFTRDCPVLSEYKFYLAFENSNCAEYLTEKLWWNAYRKGAVPVVMGAARADYERLCPPNSFVHVDDFESPAELAAYLSFLMTNEAAYNSFFEWRRRYKVVNEHGYFGAPSAHLCRLCEALNRAGPSPAPKTYADLGAFWNPKTDCRPPTWTPPKDSA